jgi:hypothetical protein
MGTLRAILIVLSIACLMVCLVSPNVFARGETRWALQVGNVIVGGGGSIEHPEAQLFHQQTLSTTDFEDFNLGFPIMGDGLSLGPTSLSGGLSADGLSGIGGSASGNIVPFGPVNLAFPDLDQVVDQTVAETSTGFFHANWAYMSDLGSSNLGNSPLGISFTAAEPFTSGRMIGSGLVWPYMTPLQPQTADYNMLDIGNIGAGLSSASSITPEGEAMSQGINI